MDTKSISPVDGLYGLVICGGNSMRMGMDKALLDYHGKPQCYHIYDMLKPFCEKVYISCNEQQADGLLPGYEKLVDLPYYSNNGPVSALLTALTYYPHKNFLFIGCDYPFLKQDDINAFIPLCRENITAAFYNEEADLFEPMLACYHQHAKHDLLNMFEAGQYSLQHFLRTVNAAKFHPANKKAILSIDTMPAFIKTKHSMDAYK